MRKWLVSFLFFSSLISLKAANLTGFFSYCNFDSPGHLPYIETYLNVSGASVKFIPVGENLLQGQLEVLTIVRFGEKIIHYDKYNLMTPVIHATDSIPDMIDMQRMNLETGTYELELSVRDKNVDAPANISKQTIRVGFPTDTISISDIELIESFSKADSIGKFTKSGYNLTPLVNGNAYYPIEINHLRFYAEIYRSDALKPADDVLVRYYISGNENNRIVNNYVVSSKEKSQSVYVIIGDFPIENLFSGNYILNIEVRNKKNQLIALKKLFFQRINPESKPMITEEISKLDVSRTFVSTIDNPDTLAEYIRCLYPISSSVEFQTAQNITDVEHKNKDLHYMQQYLYSFWVKRNPEDPKKAWTDYMIEVEKANNAFKTQIKKGYETDRGRVYLQYGAPNQLTNEIDEASTYPYEIWQYYKLSDQSNRRFVFYARERSSNEYSLIHSDAKGEIYDPGWQSKIFGVQNLSPSLEPAKPIDLYGTHSNDLYSNPH